MTTAYRIVLSEIFGCALFSPTTDFSNQNDSLRLGIIEEDFQAVDKVGAVEGVSSDTNAQRLAKTHLSCLVHGLVGEGSRPRNNTHAALLVDMAGHDTNLALQNETLIRIYVSMDEKRRPCYLPRCNDAWAVGTNQTRLVLSDEPVFDANHVLLRDTLGDADNQRDFGIDGLQNGLSSAGRRDVDDRCVWLYCLFGLKLNVGMFYILSNKC